MKHHLPQRSTKAYLWPQSFEKNLCWTRTSSTHPNGQSLRTVFCHTSSGPARSSSNYTRMVKRKSWAHVPDSLRPVLSTNSKPQDSHEKKLENQVFNNSLGWFPTPPPETWPIPLNCDFCSHESANMLSFFGGFKVWSGKQWKTHHSKNQAFPLSTLLINASKHLAS